MHEVVHPLLDHIVRSAWRLITITLLRGGCLLCDGGGSPTAFWKSEWCEVKMVDYVVSELSSTHITWKIVIGKVL